VVAALNVVLNLCVKVVGHLHSVAVRPS
jgi:hypothetical protein